MAAVLADRIAVVTGATSGIGAAIARRLCSDGATVIGIGRRTAALAAEEVRSEGRFVALTADLTDPSQRAQAIAAITARAPRLDLLINAAGEASYDGPIALGSARWRELFELNLHAALDLGLGLVSSLGAGSHVVNVSSVTARFTPNARFAAYAATKAALDAATDALRLELDPLGIAVTTIAPGLVDTPLYDKVAGFAATRDKIARQIPRWLDAADVADAVAWVVSRPPHVVVADLVMLPRGQGR